MGQTLSQNFDQWRGKQQKRILMLGLDAAGKTTLLYKLRIGEVINSGLSFSFSPDNIKYKNMNIYCWDIGGSEKMRILWKQYFIDTIGLIYVVDSSDKDRIELARDELNYLLSADKLKGVRLLVLANKQDIANMSITEITDILNLHSIRDREWYILSTCGLQGIGFNYVYEWIQGCISKAK